MKCTAWVTMLRNHTWFTGGLRWNSINAFQKAIGILHNLVFPIGRMENSTEG